MSDQQTDTSIKPLLDPVFAVAFLTVALAWFAGGILLLGVQWIVAPVHTSLFAVVTLLSGLVALFALLPGLFWQQLGVGRNSDYSAPLIIGVLLRLVGTIALFLVVRYEMAASSELIAVLTIGWYLFLTVVEVITLSRRLAKTSVQCRTQKVCTKAVDSGSSYNFTN